MKLYSAADVYPFWKYFHFSPPARHREHKKRHEKKMFHFISFRIISYFPARKREEMPKNNNRIDEFQRRIHSDPKKIKKTNCQRYRFENCCCFREIHKSLIRQERKIVGSDFRRGTQKSFLSHLDSLARRSIDREPFKVPLFLLINKFSGESVKFINISCHFV